LFDLGFWVFGFLGFWGFGVLGFWGFGVLGFCEEVAQQAFHKAKFQVTPNQPLYHVLTE